MKIGADCVIVLDIRQYAGVLFLVIIRFSRRRKWRPRKHEAAGRLAPINATRNVGRYLCPQKPYVLLSIESIPGKENKLITADDGTVVFGYTITQLNVTEVFKGNINEDYPINITEEYYTLSGNGNEVYTQGNYMPAQESGEYIFFLKAYDSTSPYAGMYFPVDLEYGKYSVDLAETFTTPANASAAEYEVIALDEKYVEFATRVIEDYLQN